jgi:starch-binding outer membrane protein, SusD/RagB family
MNIKKILLTTAVAVLCTSCGKDYLELANPNQQTTATFWKNDNDALMAVNAVYQSL